MGNFFRLRREKLSWTPQKHTTPTIIGYLRYKTITSQNVLSEAQIKIFLSFVEKLFSKYSSFCIFNHTMIYRIYDVTMSIST